jgi:hypothetical protein
MNNSMKSVTLLFIILITTSVHTALAWSGAGHEVIAAEAFRELSPESKAECFDLLKAHPDFTK